MVGDGADAPTGGTTDESTKARARALLEEAGLSKPARGPSPRRLAYLAILILVLLVVIVGGSLFALDRLQARVASTSSTTSTSAGATSTTSTVPVTTTTGAASPGTHGQPTLVTYATESADQVALRAIGTGGQALELARTSAPTFITDPHENPVVVYWWTGGCVPCAPENYVVVSALEALGGRFGGLAPASLLGTATIGLRGATFRGPVVLEAAEVDDAHGRPDQGFPEQASQQYRAYDRPPYTTAAGGYPFLDVAGRYVLSVPGFTPALLTGRSVGSVAAQLATPDSVLARAILGNANELDAAICDTLASLSRPLPAACRDPSVTAIEASLPQRAPRDAAAR